MSFNIYQHRAEQESKRLKANETAKKSRDKRRQMEFDLQNQVMELERKNKQLKEMDKKLDNQINKVHNALKNMIKPDK